MEQYIGITLCFYVYRAKRNTKIKITRVCFCELIRTTPKHERMDNREGCFVLLTALYEVATTGTQVPCCSTLHPSTAADWPAHWTLSATEILLLRQHSKPSEWASHPVS